MHKSRVTNWNANKMKEQLFAILLAEQNKRLIDYAKSTIIEIGNAVREYHSANNMDRTGNLLNSLCWGVSYNGRLVDGGFYRDAGTKNAKIGTQTTSQSFMHEWFDDNISSLEPINGRQLAQEYLTKYGNNGAKGWRVFFAILAPYWGYWEKGFTMKSGGGTIYKNTNRQKTIRQTTSFKQFAVMTMFYDSIRKDLKPARTRFRVSVRKYTYEKLRKRYEKTSGF